MSRWIPLLALMACAPPRHHDPVPTRGTEPPLDAPRAEPPPKVRVALFDPTGIGSWGDTLKLTPPPAERIASCVHGRGFAWVRLDTRTNATDLVDASADLADSARSCITRALARAELPPEQTAMQLLVYVTFSPE